MIPRKATDIVGIFGFKPKRTTQNFVHAAKARACKIRVEEKKFAKPNLSDAVKQRCVWMVNGDQAKSLQKLQAYDTGGQIWFVISGAENIIYS